MNKTVQDQKVKIESVKKNQTEGNLEMKIQVFQQKCKRQE